MASAPLPNPRPAKYLSARDPDAVLRARAAALAQPRGAADEVKGEGAECVLFRIDTQHCAIEARHIREAVSLGELTPLPGLPPTFRGLANIRSQILPIFDLRVLFQLSHAATHAREEAVVLNYDGAQFGLAVDAMLGSKRVRLDRLRREVPALQEQFLLGLAEEGLLVLDVPAVAAALTLEERGS